MRYIKVYNDILDLILKGLYPENSKLPSEFELSQMLGVSRMTLRQALLLLKEDGYIVMRHGTGSFVCKTPSANKKGLEKKTNPIYKCCHDNVVLSKMTYRMDVPNEYVIKTLGKMVPWVMGVDRLYDYENIGKAYAFTMIPFDTLEQYAVQYNNEKELIEFVENSIYEHAHATNIEIKFVKGNDLVKAHNMPCENNQFILLLEVVYDNKGNVLMHNKFYIPEENAQLNIFTY